MRIALTGASGFIGSALTKALTARGDDLVRFTRNREKASKNGFAFWDPSGTDIDADALEGLDAVVHLAGEGIAEKRWTDAQKQKIRRSRTDGTTLLASTLAGLSKKPTVLLSGSAVGYYGTTGSTETDESGESGDGFLAEVCREWEAAAQPAIDAGITTTFLRTGVVMSPEGGALAKQLPFFKLGLGGKSGPGTQYLPWISMRDYVSAILSLLDVPHSGPVNLTAPNPVTNAVFAKSLASELHRPSFVIPMIGPRLLLGKDLADNLLLDSLRVVPGVLSSRGFDFEDATLDSALHNMLR